MKSGDSVCIVGCAFGMAACAVAGNYLAAFWAAVALVFALFP